MTDATVEVKKLIGKLSESEQLWYSIVMAADHDRVDFLMQALVDQFALLMAGEENCNVNMALIAFLSRYILMMSKQAEISPETATMLIQMGLQRGVSAHEIADKAKLMS